MKKIDSLPTQNDYANMLHEAARQYPINTNEELVRYFQARMRLGHSFKAHLNQAVELGYVLEPTDRTIGKPLDPDFTTSAPFQFGYGYGLLTTMPFFGEIKPKEVLSQIHAPVSPDEDPLDYKHQLATIIVEAGEQGMAIIGERAADELEQIETRIIPDVTKQRYFRIGAGVVLYATHRTISAALEEQAKRDRSILQEALDDSPDWDAELTKLLDTYK